MTIPTAPLRPSPRPALRLASLAGLVAATAIVLGGCHGHSYHYSGSVNAYHGGYGPGHGHGHGHGHGRGHGHHGGHGYGGACRY